MKNKGNACLSVLKKTYALTKLRKYTKSNKINHSNARG